MKKIYVAIVFLASLGMFGCSTLQIIDSSELVEGVKASSADAKTSWWYLGETDSYYFLAKKTSDGTSSYRVKKSGINITVPYTFWPGTKEPERLKRENVKIK